MFRPLDQTSTFAATRPPGVSGAQPADVLLGALRRAWADLARPDVVPVVEGAACGPDGCD